MFTVRFALICAAASWVVACGGGTASTAGGGGSRGGGSGSGSSGGGGGGGDGSTTFYLPFVATSSSAGDTGLFVIPSDQLSSTPISVSRTPASQQTVGVVGLSKQLTRNGSNSVTASAPYALLYYAAGADGTVHVFGLKLADTSVAPTPTQVSSLALNSVANICGSIGSAQLSIDDPTTLFVVLQTNAGGASSCGKGGDVYQVVHYTDSSATNPIVVNIAPPLGDLFTPLYRADGALGGAVLLDSTTGDLDFYASDTFTTPTVLTTGVTSWLDMVDDTMVNGTGSIGASTAFLNVTTSSGTSVWRVTSSGAASSIYAASGSLSVTGVADANNVYFTDTVAPSLTSSSKQSIYQEAFAGGTPLALYNTSTTGVPTPYFLVGSNGTSLVMTSSTPSTDGGPSTSVLTLSVGAPATPTPIAGPFSGIVFAAMCPATFGDVSGDDLLLNLTLTQGSITAPTSTFYSTEVVTPSGEVEQPLLPNSVFPGLPTCSGSSGSVLQVRGITDTNGGYGGGTVNAFNFTSFSATALGTTSGSGSYTVPSGDQLLGTFMSGAIGLGGVGPTPPPNGAHIGIAFDVSKSLIVPVTVPNSNVNAQLVNLSF